MIVIIADDLIEESKNGYELTRKCNNVVIFRFCFTKLGGGCLEVLNLIQLFIELDCESHPSQSYSL